MTARKKSILYCLDKNVQLVMQQLCISSWKKKWKTVGWYIGIMKLFFSLNSAWMKVHIKLNFAIDYKKIPSTFTQ